ncbi:hypothetical protein AAHC03_012972 [Spirometra sp. Aus1]
MLSYFRDRFQYSWHGVPLSKGIIEGPISTISECAEGLAVRGRQASLEYNKGPSSQTQAWSKPIKYKPSEYARSRELGRLDPALYVSEKNEDLYDVPLGHLGRLWFTLSYDQTSERLHVTVHKARNLRSPNYRSLRFSIGMPADLTALSILTPVQTQDCRVKLYLENAKKKFQTSSTKRQTNNPTFEESFSFQIPVHELQSQSIRFEVLSVERTKRSKVVGFVSFPLSALKNSECQWQPLRVARDLQLYELSSFPGSITLMVALTYFPATSRLTVGVFECQNLPLKSNGFCIAVYAKVVVCKGIQGKLHKAKRTQPLEQRRSFDESFTFSKIEDPSNMNVRIVLMQQGFIDKSIAFVVLGNELVSKGSGISHWHSMIENADSTITEIHELQPIS